MKIAVYAIAKNEAAHVERFMAGVEDADVVIVADTGSTDDTIALLRQFGATVREVSIDPWRFDTARNTALALVPEDVDVCFSLDMDEVPGPGWRERIETEWLPGTTRMSVDFVWSMREDGSPKDVYKHWRLHSRHGFRWRNLVHETLTTIGDEQVAMSTVTVVHLPDSSKPRSQYLPLLERAIAEDQSDPQLFCWLGREYMMAGRVQDAIDVLERYLLHPDATWQPERAAVLRYLASCWNILGHPDTALDYTRRGCDECPWDREPWVGLARACHDRGLWEEGLYAAEKALAITERPMHYLVNDDDWRALPADLASVCAWNLGRADVARGHVVAALATAPDDQRIAANAALMGVEHIQLGDPDSLPKPAPTSPATPDSPYLVSVTLTGNAREIVGDALASVVDWVDCCLVIDTGVTDDTLHMARAVAREKYREIVWPWRDDFAAARNAALDAAADLGAAWAVMLDTDERIVPGSALESLRETLRAEEAAVLMVSDSSGHYAKERFFRLPRQGHYTGPTHEAFISVAGRARLHGARFIELAKTPEQFRAKVERDYAILTQYVAQHPDDPRWHYYLGDTLHNLSDHRAAIESFERCLSLPGWDEQAAWAAYRAAECALALGDPDDAVQWCARGLTRHAGTAELAWLAGYASWQAGRPTQAAAWACMSIANGAMGNAVRLSERAGFRHLPGLYEGPYDILRFALRALGDDAGADEAEHMYHVALGARQAAVSG